MKNILLIAAGALVLLGGGIGGTVALHGHGQHAAVAAKPPPPKPLFFAELDDLVVSVPADIHRQSAPAYVQFAVQFATHGHAGR